MALLRSENEMNVVHGKDYESELAVAVDLARVAPNALEATLAAQVRECLLTDAIPVIASVDGSRPTRAHVSMSSPRTRASRSSGRERRHSAASAPIATRSLGHRLPAGPTPELIAAHSRTGSFPDRRRPGG